TGALGDVGAAGVKGVADAVERGAEKGTKEGSVEGAAKAIVETAGAIIGEKEAVIGGGRIDKKSQVDALERMMTKGPLEVSEAMKKLSDGDLSKDLQQMSKAQLAAIGAAEYGKDVQKVYVVNFGEMTAKDMAAAAEKGAPRRVDYGVRGGKIGPPTPPGYDPTQPELERRGPLGIPVGPPIGPPPETGRATGLPEVTPGKADPSMRKTMPLPPTLPKAEPKPKIEPPPPTRP
ncbi:uncharacterized protein METZ01_LOCUS504134, partial [marine metagenome]